MKITSKLLLTLFLIFWTVFATLCFLFESSEYVGKTYFESEYFEQNHYEFLDGLRRYELNTFDAEESKKSITVTEEEIDYYRNYYGTLAEQVTIIKQQYADDIDENKSTYDEETTTILEEERDRKIAEVRANFEDDSVVEAKIRAIKEKALDNFATSWKQEKNNFKNNYSYFAYDFTNVDTGQNYSSGDVKEASVYKQTFGQNKKLFDVDEERYIYVSEYSEEIGLLYDSFKVNTVGAQFSGTITIPKSLMKRADFAENYEAFTISKMIYYIVWATGALTLLGLLFFAKPKLSSFHVLPAVRQVFTKWPIDTRVVVVGIFIFFTVAFLDGFTDTIHAMGYYYEHYLDIMNLIELAVLVVLSYIVFSALIISAVWLYEDVRSLEQLTQQLQQTITYKIWEAATGMFLIRSIGVQSLAMIIVFFLAGLGLAGVLLAPELLLIYIPLFVLVLIPTLFVFMRRMGYLTRIMMQTKDMAEGRLTSNIEVKGKSPFADLARNLNDLRDGVSNSMTEQAKSERMKTELITNVSHDLRTPLTSIITYTDLLKNPDLDAEERAKYIGILDKKSARLKTLIEDLFEVSKMASGNIELVKQRVDLAQLLQQAIGEHGEDYTAAGLDLRVTISEQPIFAYVDGQKWWRVVDNLIINARKYSLPGTRVYVNLKVTGNEAEFTVKNVAKYELNEDATELVERFKRADTSRHTEGSGLGLAIAQSIVDLHGGRMNISVDGDLFKVCVVINIAY
ncbi:sensor histidine kinase [Solibacillus sp. FSL H8-0538]|uniref:sensor histidine kinase n=1 Tax=Solibacillus sp. FSL H8-0538 TaxID=2921400 RepID=UPI0030F64E59